MIRLKMSAEVIPRKSMDLGKILRFGAGDWVAWWYSGIYKSVSRSTEPKVLVGFREYLGAAFSDKTVYRRLPLSALSQLTLGSIWTRGRCYQRLGLEERQFSVDFRDGGWQFTRFRDAQPYPFDCYPLDYATDKNWMIEFGLGGSARLVVPCVEFFYRYYGVSAYVKQIIATRPWSDVGFDLDARSHLYAADDKKEMRSGTWHVTLRKRLRDEDAALLAYAKYRRDTETAVKRIYSQLEVGAGPAGKNLAFIQADPWFHEPTRLKVRGVPFEDGSFLGLQIVGFAQPQNGPEIVRDRENSNRVNESAPPETAPPAYPCTIKPRDEADSAEGGVPMTGDDDPDWGTEFQDVKGDPLETLGVPLNVADVWREKGKHRSGDQRQGENQRLYSGGEPYGEGKGIGKANIETPHTDPIKTGFLRSMWEALYSVAWNYNQIKAVDWFTLTRGFCSISAPELIPLAPWRHVYDPTLRSRPDWAYHRIDRTVPRGLMVVRILTTQGAHFVVEIERRSDGSGEAFSGLAFRLHDDSELESWINMLVPAIRAHRGVFKNCLPNCPPGAKVFRHPQKRGCSTEPLELAAHNALVKLGIHQDGQK